MSAREHVFTLGIEEEFQIIDPQTRELRSHIQQILEGGRMTLKERIKPEMHQSVVELGTEVCQDATAARQQVIALRRRLAMVAAGAGLTIASAGTHPFSHWRDQLITTDERYAAIVKRPAADCAGQSHLRTARSRRYSRSRSRHQSHESGALFSAACLCAVG
jgi:gamma-glutamyl:cysteine ligase YbdK (ATP-grasp superfamily)